METLINLLVVTKPMAESIEQILAKEPHITRIESPEQWQFPNIDYSLWASAKRKNVKECIEIFQDFLRGPYIVDDFESSHNERRQWRSDMSQKYVWFHDYYNTNALRGGDHWIRYLLLRDIVLEGYCGKQKKLKQYIQHVRDCIPEKYDSKSSEEKVRFVKEYKQRLYGVLQFISEDKTLPQRILDYVSGFIGRFRNCI
jgi:hypothetical protein